MLLDLFLKVITYDYDFAMYLDKPEWLIIWNGGSRNYLSKPCSSKNERKICHIIWMDGVSDYLPMVVTGLGTVLQVISFLIGSLWLCILLLKDPSPVHC